MSHDNEPVRSIVESYAQEIVFGGPIDYVYAGAEREKVLGELKRLPQRDLEKLAEQLSAHAARVRKERKMIIEVAICNGLAVAKKG